MGRLRPRRSAGSSGAPPSGSRAVPADVSAEVTVAINARGRRNFRRRRLRAALRRWRTVLIGLVVLALVVSGVWLLYFSSFLITRGVTVEGSTEVSPARVRSAAEVPIGTQLARLDVDAIRARVESIAAIERAEVSRSWPHTLSIRITERVPVAVVERDGKTRTVDLHGVLFNGIGADLPRIRTSVETDSVALAQGARVASSLPPQLRSKTSYVELDSIDTIALHLADGRRVVWGSAAGSAQKAEVALALLEGKRTGKARVFDVSVPGRPTTR